MSRGAASQPSSIGPSRRDVQRVPLQPAGRVLRAGTYYADLEVGGQRVRRTLVFLD